MCCEKIQGNVTTLAFSPPHQFLKDGIPYMNEVQEKILRQHLLAGTWKVRRWALVSSALCSWLSFTQITFCRNAETYWSELPTVPACRGVWRKTQITGYYVENWVQVVKWFGAGCEMKLLHSYSKAQGFSCKEHSSHCLFPLIQQ